MSGFTTLLNMSTPNLFQDFVTVVVEAITREAEGRGYKVTVYTNTKPDPTQPVQSLMRIQFRFTNPLGVSDGNLIVSQGVNASQPEIHAITGFPNDVLAFVHKLSAATQAGTNTNGAQAKHQDNFDQGNGRNQVAVTATQGSQGTGNQVAAAAGAVAMIDVATVRRALEKNERTRQYIGASGIGNNCAAYQVLSLRGFPSDVPKPQMLRIFDQGHRIEEIVVQDLKDAGHAVEELDPTTKEQWEYTSHGGHHVCHLDGFITLLGTSERMTLEIKSMNRKMFDQFKTKGVKLSHNDYWKQCIDGIALLKMNGIANINKCFFVAYCKDNSMYHAEIIDFDPEAATVIFEAIDVLTSSRTIIRRAGDRKQDYDCTQCFKKTSCWEPAQPTPSCVQCAHAVPITSGSQRKLWHCNITSQIASQPCGSFKLWRPERKL